MRSRMPIERVDHDIADSMDLLGRDPFPPQVLIAVGRGRKEQIGDGVRHAPVDLFRHRLVEAAQARLDVGDRDQQLLGRQAARHGRVHVAEDDHEVGLLRQEHLLELDHDPGRLLRVGAGAGAEEMVRLRQLQVLEERLGHHVIVMLTRVDDQGLQRLGLGHREIERGHLHEVGSGPDNQEHLCHVNRSPSVCKTVS